MKRLISIIVVGAVMLVGIALATPFFIKKETIRNQVINHLETLTGRNVTFQGEPSVSLNPFLGIEISNLVIDDPLANDENGVLLSVEKVNAKIDFLKILTGTLKIGDYSLLRPKLSLKIYPDGSQNWSLDNGALKQAVDDIISGDGNIGPAASGSMQLGTVTIRDGMIELNNEIQSSSETVSAINGTLDWADASNFALFAGNGIWRGEGVTTNVTINSPLQLLSGGETALSIKLSSQPFSFEFNGQANMFANLFVKGDFTANTPSINRFANLLGVNVGNFNNVENWNASGQLEATTRNVSLSGAKVSIGNNKAEGVLRIAKNEQQKYRLDGTLAFENIDLDNVLLTDLTNSSNSLAVVLIQDLDVDLRISSPSVSIGNIGLEAVAASLLVDDKSWILDIGNANAFDGNIIAKFGERVDESKRQAFIELTAANVNLSRINALIWQTPVTMNGRSSFKVNARSNTLADGILTSGLNGALEGSVTNGQISGVNLQTLLSHEDGAELIIEKSFNETAATDFDTMDFKIFMNNGIAAVSKAELATATGNIQIIGDANLTNGELDLQIQKKTEDGPGPKRLFVSGSLSSPDVSMRDGPVLNN